MNFIFLIGPPGSGKTVCGQKLAALLKCDFRDTDSLIEAQQKLTVKELFDLHGEAHFRQLEVDLLQSLPQTYQEEAPVVFATGGGLPVYNNNLERLERLGKVVALCAPVAVLADRVRGERSRPLLLASAGEDADKLLLERLSELLSKRASVYDSARYKIDTSGLKPDEVAHEILRVLYSKR